MPLAALIPWVIGGGTIGVIGWGVGEVGEGIEKTGNGLLMGAIAGSLAYIVYKKVK